MMVWPGQDQIEQAASRLESGELVAFPTETVYGLGGDARQPEAVSKIFALKGRPATHPVIVHLAPEADPGQWVRAVPPAAVRLIEAFWPGPLTLILERAPQIPAAVSGGQTSIGLRCPSHPVAQALLRAFQNGQGGIAAPSANRFGRVSPTTAQHVRDEFGAELPVLDGGPCEVGIESTILDLSRGFPALLRPGGIGAWQLAEVLGLSPEALEGAAPGAPRVSGSLAAHYAPATPLKLMTVDAIVDRLAARRAAPAQIAVVARAAWASRFAGLEGVRFVAAPADPDAYARELYSLLRSLDQVGLTAILVETLPASDRWAALNDRLGRAAAAFINHG